MNPSSSLRVQGELEYTSNQQPPTPKVAILKLLKIVAGDTSLASDFTQAWMWREFQLGDNLTRYSHNGENTEGKNFLYLVCQGRVRLLGWDATLGREVSTQLLLTGETFGADDLFCNEAFAYQAIAATAGCVAQITITDLHLWLQRLPHLKNYLQQLVVERQGLIFFKTCTELRSLTSHTVKQLLPYMVARKITAGSSLVEATPPTQGRFWLLSGKIQNLATGTIPPVVGGHWGYPQSKVMAVIAQTDLLVYHLSCEHWESARAIAPQIFSDISEPGNSKSENKLQISPIPGPAAKVIELPTRQPQLEKPESVIGDDDINFYRHNHQRRAKAWFWRAYPFIGQQSSSDCGAACLAMISQYWGRRLSLNTLRNLARVDRMGASLQSLAAAAQSLGYDVLPVRASLNKLDSYDNPWIAHWQDIHYLVVWRVKSDRLLIGDPAIGKRWLSRLEFEASWTGYALLLNPSERLYAFGSEQISWLRYWQLLKNHRQLISQIIFVSVLVQACGLAIPLSAQVILDQVLPLQNYFNLNVLGVGLLIVGLWRVVLTAGRQFLLDYFANRIDLALVRGFINYTLQLPLQFFASRQVEDILSRVQENRKIQVFLSRQALGVTTDAVMVVIYLGLMADYNLQLTLLVLGWILPIVFLTFTTSPLLKGASRSILQASAAQNASVVDMMTGIVTVKTAAVEHLVQKHWEGRFQNMLKARFRGQKLANKLQLLSNLINHLGSTMVLWFGATLVMGGGLSLGHFVAFNMLIGNVTHPVLALVKLWDEFQEALISLERLNDVFTSQPEENPQKPLLVIPPIRGAVHFENVSFRYDPDQQRNTLQNISFQAKPRQTIAIVGQSGSGKSTLVNLLAGLYRPNVGRILIDGHDIAQISPQSLRAQLGLVSQDCFLFAGTILENITLYSGEFTQQQAQSAAKLADAHTFIQELPLGYNTQVGERGALLSLGQRQKIAIARALIRNPGLLILDEATSALDAESEYQFQQNLTRISQECTTLIIAHRLSTVRHADSILVLDRGILVEQGSHDELIAIGGLYYHLAQRQSHL